MDLAGVVGVIGMEGVVVFVVGVVICGKTLTHNFHKVKGVVKDKFPPIF